MLSVHDLVVRYDQTAVLHHINLTIAQGEIVCLLGASGCGKTTLLRAIAGLEPPAQGDIRLDGRSVRDVAVHRRGFGLMFQDFALFPHLNVIHNAAFGLRMQGVGRRERLSRAREVLRMVGLAGFDERDVSELSGGEKQRVALARSLAPNPRLLMLDEPLGSLDAALRERLALDLRQIIKDVGLTAIHVTHDQQEAFAIADRVAVMNDGRIEQIDAPATLYNQPQTVFVARFLGLNNIVSGAWLGGLADTPDAIDIQADGAYLLHPDSLHIVAESHDAHLIGRVVERVFFGGYYRLRVRIDVDTEFAVRVTGHDVPRLGDRVGLRLGQTGIIRINRTAENE